MSGPDRDMATTIGEAIARRAERHAGKSGFAIIRYGRPALAARVALADLAEKSLDVQYYIWEADATGRILAERLIRAAERGVRVRVLLDDINLSGQDAGIAALDAHPNAEIRIFNPFANRRWRVFDFVADMVRVNHRMHNKMMIMDDIVSLVGGRNVGSHYFQAHSASNFRDLDIVGVGGIVTDTTNVFERFWEGPWSVPVFELVDRKYGFNDHQVAIREIRSRIESDDYPFSPNADTHELVTRLESILDDLVWAPGRIVWEDPAAIYNDGEGGRMNRALFDRLGQLDSDLLIESAYFVPGSNGIAEAKSLGQRGVRVRVLTNSLAANDVLAAHAGYANYRRGLIEAGVELYELRPFPGPVHKKVVSIDSKAALHTKAMVFDRKDVFIGSFNLDPRSSWINTEAGIYVESEGLAQQVIDYMDEGVSPQNAYRVLMNRDGSLRWRIETDDLQVDFGRDPDSRWYQRCLAGAIGWLPIERQL